jgi:hypothetical protein
MTMMWMKSKVIGMVFAFSLAAGALVAHAGKKEAIGYVKVVDGAPGEGTAIGDLGAVRYNTTSTEFIGCLVRVYVDKATEWTGRSVTCAAYDSTTYKYRTCYSSFDDVASVAAAINGDSRVEFAWMEDVWHASNHCRFINVTNSSELRPKSV